MALACGTGDLEFSYWTCQIGHILPVLANVATILQKKHVSGRDAAIISQLVTSSEMYCIETV